MIFRSNWDSANSSSLLTRVTKGQLEFAKYDLFLSEQIAGFLQRLQQYKDMDGTVLDNTVVFTAAVPAPPIGQKFAHAGSGRIQNGSSTWPVLEERRNQTKFTSAFCGPWAFKLNPSLTAPGSWTIRYSQPSDCRPTGQSDGLSD